MGGVRIGGYKNKTYTKEIICGAKILNRRFLNTTFFFYVVICNLMGKLENKSKIIKKHGLFVTLVSQ